jgi:hypothetical protein
MRRIGMGMRQLQSPLYLAVVLCLVARLAGLALGWALWQQGLVPIHPLRSDQVYLDVEPMTGPVTGWALGVWQRLDTLYYLQIAMVGYSADDGTVVFPPFYPLLIRLVGAVLGGQYLLAALLISSVACVGLLVLVYRTTLAQFDAGAARRAVVYQVFFPTAYVLIAPYAESLMLWLMLLAFLWARQDRWWLAGIAAFLATLTRLQAVMLVVPLTYIYLRRFCLSRHTLGTRTLRPQVLALAAAPAAALGYNLYLAWRGLPVVQSGFAQQWHSILAVPGTDLLIALRELLAGGINFQRALSLGLVTLFLILTGVALRRLEPEYGLYMAAVLLYTLSRHDLAGRALLSASRHMLVVFPGFVLLGAAGRRPWLHRLILYPSLALYLFLMGVFFMWGYAE